MVKFKIKLRYLFLLLVIIIFTLIIKYIWNYRTHYNYDVTSDYHYENFGDTIIQTTIADGKVFFDFEDKWGTGFLKLNLKTNFKGRLLNPKVYTGKETHVFERGAKGNRFINISNHLNNELKYFEIEFKHCKSSDLSCELILFKNEPLNGKRILVVSPHPDDAEIAAWGLYSKNEAFIVTITAGDYGPKNYDEIVENDSVHYLLKGRLRFWNSITVPMLGGVKLKNIANLGYSDLTLKDMYDFKDSVIKSHVTELNNTNYYRKNNFNEAIIPLTDGRPVWDNLVNDLTFIIENFKPDIIVTPHILLDYHSDHKYSSLAVFEAVNKIGKKDGLFYFYTNHLSGGVRVWPEGTMGNAVDLPPNLCGLGDSIRVHSLKLSENMQIEKTMALEAMNDLRMDLEWLWVKGTWLKFRYRTMKEIMGHEDNYFFRAVRSNEIFFIDDISNAGKYIINQP